MSRKCDHPECLKEGLHRAPKDRRLKDYYWFCEKHAREYNKAWDYYKDATAEDIEAAVRGRNTWERPTFKIGHQTRLDDPLGLQDHLGLRGRKRAAEKPSFTKEEEKALAFFKLNEGFTKKELSTAYRLFAKTAHPDLKTGNADLFRQGTHYYDLLKKRK